MTLTVDTDQYKKRAERIHAAQQRKMARAQSTKGLIIVTTGTGKGKSTAAFGMALRAVGHGMRLGVVQFIKGALPTAERALFPTLGDVRFETVGEGYTWCTQDRDRDIACARAGWDAARDMLSDESFGMVVLDELNVVLRYGYLDVEEVVAVFQTRPAMQHVVVTGRNAPDALIEAADLVSEIRNIKHPFKDQGVRAQAGVEY